MDERPADEAWPDAEADVVEWEVDDDHDDDAAAALAAEFGDYTEDLEQSAFELLKLPVVAVIGRPNVGKSTLVNRILGRREAVVEDVPGVTRDRVTYQASWNGRDFFLLDTGGWERDARGMAAQIREQAERAVREADVAMLVVDASVGATDTEEQFIR